jgi:hypothetical protein
VGEAGLSLPAEALTQAGYGRVYLFSRTTANIRLKLSFINYILRVTKSIKQMYMIVSKDFYSDL